MNKPWKVLESQYLYREPWLTVRKERVQLPNGNEIPSYFVLEYPDWINVIAITTGGQFVLIRQYRHALGQAGYELCAGVIDAGETPLQAAQRELLEESGYGGGTWRPYMVLSANPSTHANITHCFIAVGVEQVSTQQLEPTEDITVHLVPAGRIRPMLEAGEFMQSLMIGPLWRYVAEHGL